MQTLTRTHQTDHEAQSDELDAIMDAHQAGELQLAAQLEEAYRVRWNGRRMADTVH